MAENLYPSIRRRDYAKPKAVYAEEQGQNQENDRTLPEWSDGKPVAISKKPKKRWWKIPESLQWIPANLTYVKLRPVVRSALAAWISLLIFVIPRSQTAIGEASFLILVASAMSPPSDPFVAVLEREAFLCLFVFLSWAWSCLGIRLADFARIHRDTTVGVAEAINGHYIEKGPSIIIAVFIFIGSSFFLFIRAHLGQGPFLPPTVFACITLDMTLLTAALVPHPYYHTGQVIVIPVVLHSAIAVVISVLVFPSSVTARYTGYLRAVLSPLMKVMDLYQSILSSNPYSPEFAEEADKIIKIMAQTEDSIPQLLAAARLLQADVIYNRYAPSDFVPLDNIARRLTARAEGMAMYFSFIHPTRTPFPVTPAPSAAGTSMLSPSQTRHSFTTSCRDSPERQSTNNVEASISPSASPPRSFRNRLLHPKILRSMLHPRTQRYESVVGVFESQRYMDLEETRFQDPHVEAYTEETMKNLSASCYDLLKGCRNTLSTVIDWLGKSYIHRLNYLFDTRKTKIIWEQQLAEHEMVREELAAVLERFRKEDRNRIVEPYRPAPDAEDNAVDDSELPAHRYIFQAFVFQFHLIWFANLLLEMLDIVIRLEKERGRPRLWQPANTLSLWGTWHGNWQMESGKTSEDEDPDNIEGINPDAMFPRRRDPDALPPRNVAQQGMRGIHNLLTGVAGGNFLFAMKAGVLSVLLALPSLLKASAPFAYRNRFLWGIVMGQVTLARFQGDTGFELLARILSTFLGGVFGMVMWYIPKGSPYGLAAVGAVVFPFLFFLRVHWPGKPLTIMVFSLTSMLVIGYSYQDAHQTVPASPGSGFMVAWRRFVLVAVGVFAAFLFSLFPPAKTIRLSTRRLLSTTSNELGTIYCAIVGRAYSPREKDVHVINVSLNAIHSKIRRRSALRANVNYEISLSGPWPSERYHKLLEIQLQIIHSLTHLAAVYNHLDLAWARALLRRTRLLDNDFQGDILAVISLVSIALRAGSPLPEITPCPLLDRFVEQAHGLDIIQRESEEDYGLPRTLTFQTLQNEQFLFFCVGVSTTYNFITRLDRLMVATKEIVGEQYHIHGVAAEPRASDSDLGRRRMTAHFDLPETV